MSELELRALWVLSALTGLFLLLGVLEYVGHSRRLQRMRLRIHVNGSRGKSSVTRLLAGALREAGYATCAKTTGTLPRVILPDARELPVYRPMRANVIEQIRLAKVAAAADAEALVVECMALQPNLQWLSEDKLVQATHGIITNVRPDHLDVMGPGEEEVTLALCGMVPRCGSFFTGEQRPALLRLMQDACADRETECVAIGQDEVSAIRPEDMAGFEHVEHPANVALTLHICATLGIDREVALRGMWKSKPDPGALTEDEVDFFGRRLVFVNGFAANDPVSTESLWRQSLERHPDLCSRVAVFNCRADRPERSVQLGEAFAAWPEATQVFLMGSGTYLFARAAVAAGLDASKLNFVEETPTDEIFERIVGCVEGSALVLGMGNIADQGLEMVRYFHNRARRRA